LSDKACSSNLAGNRLSNRDRLLALCKQETAEKIATGLDSLRAGKGKDGEAVFDRIDSELDAFERDRI